MINKVKKFGAALAVLVVGLIGATLVGAPAQAAYSSCPVERICFFWDVNGNGQRYDFNVTIGGASYVIVNIGEPVRSNASSVKNNKANSYITLTNLPGCPLVSPPYQWTGHITQGEVYSFGGTIWNNQVKCMEVGWA